MLIRAHGQRTDRSDVDWLVINHDLADYKLLTINHYNPSGLPQKQGDFPASSGDTSHVPSFQPSAAAAASRADPAPNEEPGTPP